MIKIVIIKNKFLFLQLKPTTKTYQSDFRNRKWIL